MNSNKISCQKYVFEQNKLQLIPYLGVVSQICISDLPWKHKKTLDGTYLADFGIDISVTAAAFLLLAKIDKAKLFPASVD